MHEILNWMKYLIELLLSYDKATNMATIYIYIYIYIYINGKQFKKSNGLFIVEDCETIQTKLNDEERWRVSVT